MKYLITSSLLDCYDWLKSCPKNWQTKAYQDFCAMIRREKTPPTEALIRGMEFERLVCDKCNVLDDEQYREYARNYFVQNGVQGYEVDLALQPTCKVAKLCRNGQQQVAVKKNVQFGNDEYHLFGYVDVMFPDKIIDIKTTGKYTEGYNYVKRSQHYLYSLCTGINTFQYLVADFKESKIPRELHEIEFEMTQDENLWVLEKRISDLMNYLRTSNLFSDYCEIFTALHDDNKRIQTC